jgi:hypothetical protein
MIQSVALASLADVSRRPELNDDKLELAGVALLPFSRDAWKGELIRAESSRPT